MQNFNSKSNKNDSSGVIPSGDSILKRVGVIADGKLQDFLNNLFDHIDDSLFAMAERATDNADQNLYFEAMRECRLARGGVVIRYKGEFIGGFDAMVAAKATASLKASRLTLVRDSELEENVAIESMISKARTNFSDDLSLLSLRLDRLVSRQVIDEGNNAISPEKVTSSFIQAIGEIDLDIRVRLLVLKLFEKKVLSQLGDLYVRLNTYLANAGVLPNVQLAKKEAAATSTEFQADEGQESDQAFSALQKKMRSSQENEATNGEQSVTVLRRSALVNKLSSIDLSTGDLATNDAGYVCEMPATIDLKQALIDLSHGESQGASQLELAVADADAIDLVSMLFDTLKDDKNIGLPIRSLLNLLQIPMAKVALLDKSVFSQDVHPARKLLDEMVAAGLGWRPGVKANRDFLYKKTREVVELVLTEFSDDIHLFQQALADFMLFRDGETKRNILAAERLVDRGAGQARAEIANGIIKQEITARISGISIPARIRDTIKFNWSKLLFLVYLREGEEGESWLAALKIVDELVWSIAAKTTEPDKNRLARLIPGLKRSLFNGLTRMEVTHFEMNRLFDDLDKCHIAAANGEARWGLPLCDDVDQLDSMQDVENIKVLSGLSQGGWYDLKPEESDGILYRLSAIIDPPGKYIFIDRNGRDVISYSRAELAAKIVENAIEEIDDRLFFERALESIQPQLA